MLPASLARASSLKTGSTASLGPSQTDKLEKKNVPCIEIEVSDTQQAQRSGDVPEEKDGVNVRVVESSDPEPHKCNDQTYDCIPGGAIVNPEQPDGSFSVFCSFTCEVTYNGDYHLMTAAHCFDACSGSIIGRKVKHGGEVIGEVVEYDVNLDFAIIEPDSNVTMDDTIISEQYSILGHYSKNGVEDLRDSGETVSHYGVTTCKTQGQVDGITPNLQGGCDFDVEAPRMTTNTDDGDSGGPHYNVASGLLKSIGIIGAHWGGGSTYSWAPAAYRIADEYDITFGGSDCGGI